MSRRAGRLTMVDPSVTRRRTLVRTSAFSLMVVLVTTVFLLMSAQQDSSAVVSLVPAGDVLSPSFPLHIASSAVQVAACASASTCAGSDGVATIWTAHHVGPDKVTISYFFTGAHHVTAIACPTVRVCWATTSSQVNEFTYSDVGLLATQDAGLSWRFIKAPSSVQGLFAIACATRQTCVAVGEHDTSGDGALWRIRDGRVGVMNRVTWEVGVSVQCPSANTCVAGPVSYGSTPQQSVDVSHDGGRHWTPRSIGSDWSMSSLSCPSALVCVAVGNADVYPNSDPVEGGIGRIEWSSDGGLSWHAVYFSSDREVGAIQQVSCASTTTCAAYVEDLSGPGILFARNGDWRLWREARFDAPAQDDALACRVWCVLAGNGQLSNNWP